MDGKNSLYRHGQSRTSSVKPKKSMKQMESNAEFKSKSCEIERARDVRIHEVSANKYTELMYKYLGRM